MARDIADNVSQGLPLSSVMARYANLFPEWEVNIVRAGELGGTLPEVIEEIAHTLEMEMSLRSRVFSSMIMMIATVAVFVLVLLVLAFIQGVNGDLTLLVSRLLEAGLVFVIIVIGVILCICFWRVITRTRAGAFFLNTVITRAPLIGAMMRNMMPFVSPACWLRCGMPGATPMASVLSAARASGNLTAIYRARYEVPRLGEGASLVDVLDAVKMYPEDAMHIIRTGEATGSLPESLRKVAEYYQIDLDAQVQSLPSRMIIYYYAIIVPVVTFVLIQFYLHMARDFTDMMK